MLQSQGDDDGGFNGAGNLLQQYPNLVSESLEELREHTWPSTATGGGVLQLTEPFHYQPGDCTLHHGWCAHGGPDNTTSDNRWSYLFSYSYVASPPPPLYANLQRAPAGDGGGRRWHARVASELGLNLAIYGACRPADTRYWPNDHGVGSVSATNPGTRRVRLGDELNPWIVEPGRPRL